MSTDGGPLEVAGLEVVEVATLEDVNKVCLFYIYLSAISWNTESWGLINKIAPPFIYIIFETQFWRVLASSNTTLQFWVNL